MAENGKFQPSVVMKGQLYGLFPNKEKSWESFDASELGNGIAKTPKVINEENITSRKILRCPKQFQPGKKLSLKVLAEGANKKTALIL